MRCHEEFVKNLPEPTDVSKADFPVQPQMSTRKKRIPKKAKKAAAEAADGEKKPKEEEEEEWNEWDSVKTLIPTKEGDESSPMDVLTEVMVALLVQSTALLREAILNIWSNVFVRYVTPTSLAVLLDAFTQHEADLIAAKTVRNSNSISWRVIELLLLV